MIVHEVGTRRRVSLGCSELEKKSVIYCAIDGRQSERVGAYIRRCTEGVAYFLVMSGTPAHTLSVLVGRAVRGL